jgi:hypothetical protein
MAKIIFVLWIGNLIRKLKSVCKPSSPSYPHVLKLPLCPLLLFSHIFATVRQR